MYRLRTALRLALGSVAFILLDIGAAWAPGSITIDEVMEQLQDEQRLVAEIFAELKSQKLKAQEVLCVGFSFSGQWRELGGARAVPYECVVGTKRLAIEGAVHIYDDAGKELEMSDEASQARAVEYRQADINWKWQ
jgi:hypothetical protein